MTTSVQRIAKISARLILIAVVGLVACNLSSVEDTPTPTIPTMTLSSQPQISTSTPEFFDEFLRVSGQNLIYKGQVIYLRGANFNNQTAIKIRTPYITYGKGNISDINYTEVDYERLAQMGGNHVRWGISFNWYKDNRDNFFQVLDQHIAWARKYNLWLVLNLFTFPDDCYEGYSYRCPYWKDTNLQQELLDFWVDVARHYKDEPVIAGYDLINEPTPGPLGNKTWFSLAQNIRDAIHLVDPNHLVFVEFDSSGKDLRFLEGDNIVYSVHVYAPLALTHAEAPTDFSYPGYIPDNGLPVWWDKSSMSGDGSYLANIKTKYPITWAEQNNVPLYIGEFGTRTWVDGSLQYLGDLFDLFNSWNLNYAYFVWRENSEKGFGIYPISNSLVPWDKGREELISSKLAGSNEPEFNKVPLHATATDTSNN
jgi:hypothetical protein